MIDKKHTKKVKHLALIPVCAVVESAKRRDGRGFVGVGFDADAGVVADAEEIVDDFEARVPRGVVDGGDVADLGEFGGGVVFEEVEGGQHAGGRDVDCEFVFPDGESADIVNIVQ